MKRLITLLLIFLAPIMPCSADSISQSDVKIQLLEQKLQQQSEDLKRAERHLRELHDESFEKYSVRNEELRDRMDVYLGLVGGIGVILGFLFNWFGRRALENFAKDIARSTVQEKLNDDWLEKRVRETAKNPLESLIRELKKNLEATSEETLSEARTSIAAMLKEAEESLRRLRELEKKGRELEALKLDEKTGDFTANEQTKLNEYEAALEGTKREEDFNADEWFWKGRAEYARGDYEEAIKSYSKAIELNPKDDVAYNNRGSAKNRLGHWKEAIEDFDEAINIKPGNGVAWSNRGAVKDHLGLHKEAIKDLDEAIRINAENDSAWSNRGMAKDHLKQPKAAIKDFKQAIKINPKNVSAWTNLGGVKIDLGEAEEAIQHFDRALELDPTHRYAWNNRGCAKNNIGKYNEAVKDLTEAIRLDPSSEAAFAHRAFAYIMLDKLEQAETDNAEALRLDPEYGRAFFNQGLIEQEREKTEKACEAWRKAIELGFKEAQTKLDDFCSP